MQRGFIHQISDPDGPRRAGRQGTVTAYVGYDATADLAAYRQSDHDHDAATGCSRPATGRSALMGGGTTMVGDPSFKDDAAQAADASRRSTPTSPASSRSSPASCAIGDGPTDALMVNNADWLLAAQLRRVPARRRPPFLGQPHAVLRLRQAAARPRAVAVASSNSTT